MLGSLVDAGELKMLGTEYSFFIITFPFFFCLSIFLLVSLLRDYPRPISGESLSNGEVDTARTNTNMASQDGLVAGGLFVMPRSRS